MPAKWPIVIIAADVLAAEWPSNIFIYGNRPQRADPHCHGMTASKKNARIANSVILHALRYRDHDIWFCFFFTNIYIHYVTACALYLPYIRSETIITTTIR